MLNKLSIYLASSVVLLGGVCQAYTLQGSVTDQYQPYQPNPVPGVYQYQQTPPTPIFDSGSQAVDWNNWNRLYGLMMRQAVLTQTGIEDPEVWPVVSIKVYRDQTIVMIPRVHGANVDTDNAIISALQSVVPPPFPVRSRRKFIFETIGNSHYVPRSLALQEKY